MSKFQLYLNIALFLIVSVLVVHLKNTIEEKDRLNSNQEALMDDVTFYQTESEKNAASVQMLKLKKSEVENHYSDLLLDMKDLNIKLKRVEAASKVAIKTEYKIKTVVKDSIVYRDAGGVAELIQKINYSDSWITLRGIIDQGEFYGNINTVDTIKQIIHRVPKKWWFIKYGTKAIRQEIYSTNPHTKIVYTEYIEITSGRKRRR